MDKEKLLEEFAQYSHDSWSKWMRYLFGKCTALKDGSFLISSNDAKRWIRQMRTEYMNLPENEKISDRSEGQKIINIFEKQDDKQDKK